LDDKPYNTYTQGHSTHTCDDKYAVFDTNTQHTAVGLHNTFTHVGYMSK